MTEHTSTREALLDKIETFLREHPHMSDAQFGKQTVDNTGLVKRMRLGGDVTTRQLDRILAFLTINA